MLWIATLLAVLLTAGVPAAAAAQTAGSEAARPDAEHAEPAQADASAGDVPVSLERIRKGLSEERTLKISPALPEGAEAVAWQPTFQVEIHARPRRLEDVLEGADLMHGPVPFSSPTHSQFLAMVTPQDLYSSAGITALELLTAGLSARAIEWLLARAIAEARDSFRQQQLERIREQIRHELQEIEEARRAHPDEAEPPR